MILNGGKLSTQNFKRTAIGRYQTRVLSWGKNRAESEATDSRNSGLFLQLRATYFKLIVKTFCNENAENMAYCVK